MNFGLPLLVSKGVGTARDLVLDGENGFFFPQGDINSLSKHLRRLLDDPGLLEKLGRRSREVVEAWSFSAEVEGTLKAIEAVGSKPG